MGLFDKKDKKRRDDFDSPVESVDLGNSSGPVEKPASAAPAPAPAAAAAPAKAAAPPPAASPAPPPAAPAPPPAETDNYGIEKAIELMRTLPTENIQLVVQVVKFSLESVGIKLPVIIGDAIRRQKDLRGRVDVLTAEIVDLEQEIKQRKDEIERHEADFRETTMVRERLEMAEAHGKTDAKAASAPAATAAARTTSPSTATVTPASTPAATTTPSAKKTP